MTLEELRDIYTSNIKRFRIAQHLSQQELAEKSGLADKYISYLETGRQWGSFETLLKIANALEVDPSDLLTSVSKLKQCNEEKQKCICKLKESFSDFSNTFNSFFSSIK